MNPILLYPQNATQAKIFRETAENTGVEMVSISKKLWEQIDEMLFAEKLVALNKDPKNVSESKFKKMVERKLAE